MNNQQQPTPYLLPLQAYGLNGLNGFNNGLVSLGSSPAQLAAASGQLGKIAASGQLLAGQSAYHQQNLAVTMGAGLPGLPTHLTQLSSLPLSLAGAGIYPVMTPSLSPYNTAVQTPQTPCNMGLSQTVLATNGMTNLPKLFVPSVKVRNESSICYMIIYLSGDSCTTVQLCVCMLGSLFRSKSVLNKHFWELKVLKLMAIVKVQWNNNKIETW